MSEHYTRAEDVPRLTTAWVEEFMGVDHRALAEYTAELRHKQHDAKCLIEELREEVGIPDWIDWGKVAADYGGIIIAPYQWSRRMDPHWYYTWDCASGCIWNLEAIESLEAE
ncbi:hypothetical protein SEA_BOBBY_184 [Mycobacterium phage Bobby]|nr:hypothetical protein SEA_BOBBY_184 [Mycobacterium phage Bobby]